MVPYGPKAKRRYHESKNKNSDTVRDSQIGGRSHDHIISEGQARAAATRDGEVSGVVVNEYPSESVGKENTSMKNNEAKLRTTSDKEC
jgi:hypothetical protein